MTKTSIHIPKNIHRWPFLNVMYKQGNWTKLLFSIVPPTWVFTEFLMADNYKYFRVQSPFIRYCYKWRMVLAISNYSINGNINKGLFVSCSKRSKDRHLVGAGCMIQELGQTSLQFSWPFFFPKDFISREGEGGRKRGRETSMCGCLLGPQPRLVPCGTQTSDPLVCRLVLDPLSHTSQGTWPFIHGSSLFAFKTGWRGRGRITGILLLSHWLEWYPMATPGSKEGWEIEFCALTVSGKCTKGKWGDTGCWVRQPPAPATAFTWNFIKHGLNLETADQIIIGKYWYENQA